MIIYNVLAVGICSVVVGSSVHILAVVMRVYMPIDALQIFLCELCSHLFQYVRTSPSGSSCFLPALRRGSTPSRLKSLHNQLVWWRNSFFLRIDSVRNATLLVSYCSPRPRNGRIHPTTAADHGGGDYGCIEPGRERGGCQFGRMEGEDD